MRRLVRYQRRMWCLTDQEDENGLKDYEDQMMMSIPRSNKLVPGNDAKNVVALAGKMNEG